MIKAILAAVRTSEFWTALFMAYIEAAGAPVPDEVQVFGWMYVVLRVASKMAKFVFPNPDSRNAGWFTKD